jgi:beta-galactosidase
MFTFDRQPKDVSYFYRANYSRKPVLHIATRDRMRRSGARRQSIKVYSNLASVELFHNGGSVGKRTGAEKVKSWDVDLVTGRNTFRATSPDGVSDVAELIYFDPANTSFIAINAGSNTEVTDGGGVLWQSDTAVEGSSWRSIDGTSKPEETLRNILGTLDDPLFQRMREGNFGYNFLIADGEYEIDLRFVERKHNAAGLRVFKVLINGADAFGPIDLVADAGMLRQVSRKLRVGAVGGKGIEVRFESIQDAATLSGISVKRIY